VKKGVAMPGPAYIHILSVCPTGWRCPADLSVRIGRLAVETGIFPLYEIENGNYRLNIDLSELRPVQDYLRLQGRFRHLSEETIKEIQDRVNREYAKLKEKVACRAPGKS
jgi:pyruvate ferredoxin oxidoreductase beta subunit